MNLKNTLILAIFGLLILSITCQTPSTPEVKVQPPKPQQIKNPQPVNTQPKQIAQTPKPQPVAKDEKILTEQPKQTVEQKNPNPTPTDVVKQAQNPISTTEGQIDSSKDDEQQEIEEQKPAETPKTEVVTEQKIPIKQQVLQVPKTEQATTNLKKQQPQVQQPKKQEPKTQQPKVQQPKKQQVKVQQIKTQQAKKQQVKVVQQAKKQQINTQQLKKQQAKKPEQKIPPRQQKQVDVRAPNPNQPVPTPGIIDPLANPPVLQNIPIPSPPTLEMLNSALGNSTDENTPFYCGRKIFAQKPQTQPTKREINPSMMLGLQGKVPNIDDKNRQLLTQTSYGFSVYLDIYDTYTTKMLQITGKTQPQLINLLGNIIEQGNKILIVGPQQGVVSIAVGKLVGPTGKLYIFQPYAIGNKLITKNIQYNGLENITTIYKIGAYNQKTTGAVVGRALPPRPYSPNSQIKTIRTPQSQELARQNNEKTKKISPFRPTRAFQVLGPNQQISTDQIDNILPTDVSIDIAIIKAQRMQVKALYGMKKLIQRSPNLILIVQWWSQAKSAQDKKQTDAILKQLQDKGYKAYLYGVGNIMQCKVGKFKEIQKLTQTLKIIRTLIYFFPKTVPLPQ